MTYHQVTVTAAARFQERIVAFMLQHGSLGIIEQATGLTAYFSPAADLAALKRDLAVLRALLERALPPQELRIVYGRVPDQDWNAAWKKTFRPISAGRRFTILPPWEQPPKRRIPLIIDPGMAFGTGHHETTRSCLVLMEKHAASVPRGSFLDLGTGTGLLAIAAQKLGFKKVVGIDTDPVAVKAARKNRMLNEASGIILKVGGIEAARGPFDMIAANLMAGTLIELAAGIATRTRSSGIAILSGILQGQDRDVVRAVEQAGLVLRERLKDGKWVSLAVSR